MDDQRRNLNPHAEARLAMALWGAEYAAQNGGSMDFWDRLSESRKRLCREVVEKIKATPSEREWRDPSAQARRST